MSKGRNRVELYCVPIFYIIRRGLDGEESDWLKRNGSDWLKNY